MKKKPEPPQPAACGSSSQQLRPTQLASPRRPAVEVDMLNVWFFFLCVPVF